MSDSEPKTPQEQGQGVTLEGVTEKGKAGPKKGRRSVRWDRDPEILYRLEQVAIMMTQGASLRMIAEAMSYSHTTAQKDVARVYTLWDREAAENVERHRLFSIGQYRLIQREAWSVWRGMSADDKKRTVNPLRMIAEAESQIVGLQGTKKPEEVSLIRKMDPRELTDDELAAIIAGDNKTAGGG
jgi:hypothetical protein